MRRGVERVAVRQLGARVTVRYSPLVRTRENRLLTFRDQESCCAYQNLVLIRKSMKLAA